MPAASAAASGALISASPARSLARAGCAPVLDRDHVQRVTYSLSVSMRPVAMRIYTSSRYPADRARGRKDNLTCPNHNEDLRPNSRTAKWRVGKIRPNQLDACRVAKSASLVSLRTNVLISCTRSSSSPPRCLKKCSCAALRCCRNRSRARASPKAVTDCPSPAAEGADARSALTKALRASHSCSLLCA